MTLSDVAHGESWWQASDQRWYPPDLRPGQQVATSQRARAASSSSPPAPGASHPIPRKAVPRKSKRAAASAAAAPAPAPATEILHEIRGSALTSDLDRIGDKVRVYADRVEQWARGNKLRGSIAASDILAIDIERTYKGHWLRITGTELELVQQGLEPGPANEARDRILAIAPGAVSAGGELAAQLRKLNDLRDKGQLSTEEFLVKRKQLLGR